MSKKLFVGTTNGLVLKVDVQALDKLRQEQQSRREKLHKSAGTRPHPPYKGRTADGAVQYIIDNVVESNGCWEWQKSKMHGYAQLTFMNRNYKVSRLIYPIARGEPVEDAFVCHTCDNRACIRPDHLFLGDAKINYDDSVSKGRHIHGESHPATVLTENQALKILRECKRRYPGHGVMDFAKRFGVSRDTISRVLCRKTWTHLS